MPEQDILGEIQHPYDWYEGVKATIPSTGNLRAWEFDGFWWVHPKCLIRVFPEVNTNFITTFPTSKGEASITVSPSINGKTYLVGFHDECFAHMRSTYREIFQHYI